MFVEEARLTSTFDGPFQFVIGASTQPSSRGGLQLSLVIGFPPGRGPDRASDQYYQKQYTYQDSTELAGFGELTYRSRRVSG